MMGSRESDAASSAPLGARRVVAVILAGGVGLRMGLDIPKQFIPIAGRTSLEHSVQVFHDCDFIDEIIVVIEPEWAELARATLPTERFPKIAQIIPGGRTRNESSLRALDAISDTRTKVVFHDAVRPLIDASVIRACVDALDTYSAVDTAIPSADTIVEVDENDVLRSVPVRSTLRRGQTPQAFIHETIRRAYSLASEDPDFTATDDCSVVLKYLPAIPVTVVPGHESNIKLTHPIDIHIADKLFQLRHQTRASLPPAGGELAGSTVVVFGGSAGIGAAIVRQAERAGARVFAHSRTATGVHVEDRTSIADALASAAEVTGRIDHVVLTAGTLTVGRLTDLSDSELQHSVAVNLVAAFVLAQEAFSYLSRSHGSLLLFSSSSYTRGRANYSAYSAAKAGIVNFTQALADEWGDERIRVNCVSPSRTATPMRERAFGEEDAQSLLSAEAVAQASVQVLASTSTGQVFDVRAEHSTPLEPVMVHPE